MYAYAYLGVRSVDRKVVEAARGFGLNGWRLVVEVILPSALPNVLMALRICLVLSMTALISAEGIGTEEGIGYLVLLARQYARTDYMMLCIVLYAGLGLVFDLVDPDHRAVLDAMAPTHGGAGMSATTVKSAPSVGRSRIPPMDVWPSASAASRSPSATRSCSTASTSTSGAASSSRCSARAAPARPRCCASSPGSSAPTRARCWSPTCAPPCTRSRGWCRRCRCSATSSSASVGVSGRRSPACRALAEVGLASHADGMAGHAVGRRGAARRARPGAGARAGAAAARRAVRRARRARPGCTCRTSSASCSSGTGPQCCSSPTRSTRPSCSPTGSWCSATGSSPSTCASMRRTHATAPTSPFLDYRRQLLVELGVEVHRNDRPDHETTVVSPSRTDSHDRHTRSDPTSDLDHLWYTRCPVPTASGLAYTSAGWTRPSAPTDSRSASCRTARRARPAPLRPPARRPVPRGRQRARARGQGRGCADAPDRPHVDRRVAEDPGARRLGHHVAPTSSAGSGWHCRRGRRRGLEASRGRCRCTATSTRCRSPGSPSTTSPSSRSTPPTGRSATRRRTWARCRSSGSTAWRRVRSTRCT